MRTLSGQEILHIWETGLRQHPVDRALTILAVAFPEISRDDLLALSVGQRDGRLLEVYQSTFGAQLAAFVVCQHCREQLEFALDIADIDPGDEGTAQWERPADSTMVSIQAFELRFRLPNSLDLAVIAHCQDVVTARRLLIERCILEARQCGETVALDCLPETVTTLMAEHMAMRDPLAVIEIDLHCPQCGHRWLVLFDIVSCFWTEIYTHAKRLLREVHTLARAYGWREPDILALSAARREFYLEMVT
jgi:hypothetical protein